MRPAHLPFVFACAVATCAAGCSIDRRPPLVVSAVPVEEDGELSREDDEAAVRFAGFTQAAMRDGGLSFAQAGSAAPPDADEDAGLGCEPAGD